MKAGILVPRAHDPFGLRQGSRPLAGTTAGTRKSANHGLPAFVRSLRNLNNNGYYRLQKLQLLRLRVTWPLPEVSILGADQKDRGLWGREWKAG